MQLHAQKVTGLVRDSSEKPLSGAVVSIKETGSHTHSNDYGRFELSDILPGNYTLIFQLLGYTTIEKKVSVADGDKQFLFINMISSSVQLSEIRIDNSLNSNIQNISKLDINLRPVHSSQDILRIVPGLVIAQHAGGGKAEQIFMRGFDTDHGTDIELTVDDMPVNMVSHAHGQGYADLHFLIPELIQQVQFNKGPYYADHGDFNTAGFVDFKTYHKLPDNLAKMEGGEFGSFRFLTMMNLLNKKTINGNQTLYAANDINYADGYFDASQHFKRWNSLVKYTSYTRSSSFTLSLSNFTSTWDASGQIPSRAVEQGLINRFGSIDDNEAGNTSRQNVILSYSKEVSPDIYIKNSLYYSHYNFRLFSNFTFFLNDSVDGDMIKQQEKRNMTGYKFSVIHNGNLKKIKTISNAGFGVRTDFTQNSELSNVLQRSQLLNRKAFGNISQYNFHAFISEDLKITDKFSALTGLRYDYLVFQYENLLSESNDVRTSGAGILNPKLNLLYNPSDKLQLFIKSGSGFHSNDTRIINETDENELPRALGFDAGFISKPFKKLITGISFWVLDMEQELVYVGDEAITEPSGRTRRTGIDMMVRYQLSKYIYMDGDLNLSRPRLLDAKEGENYIPLAPDVTSTAGITLDNWKNLYVTLRYRYTGDRPANESNTVTAAGYLIFDGSIKYNWRSIELSLSAENILNAVWNEAQFDTESRLAFESESVSELHYTPGSPRWLRAGIGYKF